MSLHVQRYEEKHIPLIKAFNKRLREKGSINQFAESHIPDWLPPREDSPLRKEYYIFGDDDVVRGGYVLKFQDFFLHGCTLRIANLQSPISEGIIDHRFTLVGPQIVRHALNEHPLMYSLGMGGYAEPITKFFRALCWNLITVPFYFKVVNARNFLTRNAYLRNSPASRLALDIGGYSGIGSLSIHMLQYVRKRRLATAHLTTAEIGTGDEDIDKIWETVKEHYAFIAVRDSKTIDILYPPTQTRFRRMKIFSHGNCIGWVVTLCTQMSAHKQFGSLRVGSIIDCLSHPDDASRVINCAAASLEAEKADIIVANHSHFAWGRAFEKNAFLRGPSNYIFGSSIALTQMMDQYDSVAKEIFFMRGDGDGPINL
ncbi:MAG TPA: hypothetical protein VK470_05695 [Bacteroidota bacterium]|nr:hypothetical protein [Bacteroidota bacterium]